MSIIKPLTVAPLGLMRVTSLAPHQNTSYFIRRVLTQRKIFPNFAKSAAQFKALQLTSGVTVAEEWNPSDVTAKVYYCGISVGLLLQGLDYSGEQEQSACIKLRKNRSYPKK